MPAHDHDRLHFDELSKAGKASSVNAMSINLGNAMAHQIRLGGSPAERALIRDRFQDQLRRLSDGLNHI